MITDTQLNTLAIGFGVVSFALIMVYSVFENNVKGVNEPNDE